MKRNKRPWYIRLFRKRRPGSRFNWFGSVKKSDAKPETFRALDPATLPANVANRNLNPIAENSGQPESRPVSVHDVPAGMQPGRLAKKPRHRGKKLLVFFKKIKTDLSGLNLRTSIYSLGMFILSYLFIYFLYQFSTIVVASFFGIDSVLYYYEVYFPIGNSSNLWNESNIIIISIAGPLVSALVSLLFFRMLAFGKSLSPGLSFFLYWAAFHGAAHFLGAFVGGVITNLGMGYVANWLYMNVFIKILLSLGFLFFMGLIGYYAPGIVINSPRSEKSRAITRFANLLSVDVLPWLIGAILLWIVKKPAKIPQHELIGVYDNIILASMLFALMAKTFSTWRPRVLRSFGFTPVQNRSGLWLLAFAMLILLFFRFILANGIHFIIRMSISAGFYE